MGNNDYLQLSLFILLLSFFIILNGISGYDDSRSRVVIDSLDVAFSSGIIGENERQEVVEQVAPTPKEGAGHVFTQIDALFRAQLTDFDAGIDTGRDEMVVRTDLDDFRAALDYIEDGLRREDAGEDVVAAQPLLLDNLVSQLRSAQSGKPYRMNLTLLVPDFEDDQRRGLAQESAATLMTQFIFAGLPAELLSVAVKKGVQGRLVIQFQPLYGS